MNRFRRPATHLIFNGCLSLLLLGFTLVSSVPAQQQATYEIAVTKNDMLAMRDGVRLAADIYRPARNGAAVDGKFPVILERTPYNKDGLSVAATHYVPHGYIVIGQDVRGRYKSEGHWFPIRDDPNDGFDSAKWI